jgi:hypothetical protein
VTWFNTWLQAAIRLKWRRYRRHNAKKQASSVLNSTRVSASEHLATTN